MKPFRVVLFEEGFIEYFKDHTTQTFVWVKDFRSTEPPAKLIGTGVW